MLGGAINDPASAARGETIFDEGGERLTEAVVLAKRYPQARVVYTSGSDSSFRRDVHARRYKPENSCRKWGSRRSG